MCILLHSGQLGDVIIGSFINNFDKGELNELGGAYSDLGVKATQINKISQSFEKKEIEMLYQRGFNGANSSLMMINHYTETYSPFYDIDFMEFCLSIPIAFRMKHKLYKRWILEKHPKAADYIWKKTKRKITTKEPKFKIRDREMYITELLNSIFRKLKIKSTPIASSQNMNPLEYWYNTNTDISALINNYYKENIDYLKPYPELYNLSISMFENGTSIEKNQVLSLLSLCVRINHTQFV
ncbi:hypothetical protein [Massilibacteroides sp.]|uniref:hypothetical protein n=1 Tax=Massilibacteroides sp. TaxID=2034766 RepID=UPI00262EDD33|nr:hypothetical protein [Massilibacteroides sp.]MDD4514510.1 hypothetical protein [Massilibacteroides sp.]